MESNDDNLDSFDIYWNSFRRFLGNQGVTYIKTYVAPFPIKKVEILQELNKMFTICAVYGNKPSICNTYCVCDTLAAAFMIRDALNSSFGYTMESSKRFGIVNGSQTDVEVL